MTVTKESVRSSISCTLADKDFHSMSKMTGLCHNALWGLRRGLWYSHNGHELCQEAFTETKRWEDSMPGIDTKRIIITKAVGEHSATHQIAHSGLPPRFWQLSTAIHTKALKKTHPHWNVHNGPCACSQTEAVCEKSTFISNTGTAFSPCRKLAG